MNFWAQISKLCGFSCIFKKLLPQVRFDQIKTIFSKAKKSQIKKLMVWLTMSKFRGFVKGKIGAHCTLRKLI